MLQWCFRTTVACTKLRTHEAQSCHTGHTGWKRCTRSTTDSWKCAAGWVYLSSKWIDKTGGGCHIPERRFSGGLKLTWSPGCLPTSSFCFGCTVSGLAYLLSARRTNLHVQLLRYVLPGSKVRFTQSWFETWICLETTIPLTCITDLNRPTCSNHRSWMPWQEAPSHTSSNHPSQCCSCWAWSRNYHITCPLAFPRIKSATRLS